MVHRRIASSLARRVAALAGGFGWSSPRRGSGALASLLAANAEALLVVDAEGVVSSANAAAVALLGTDPGGRPSSRYLPAGLLAADRRWPQEVEVTTEGGSRFAAEVAASPVGPLAPGATLLRFADVSARKVRLAELERLALHDALTGLPNRTLLLDRLNQALRAGWRGDAAMAVMLLDLDRFKQVNDTLGHQMGDKVLQAVAPRLAEPLRQSDTLARLGGDEFCILLPAAADAEDACRVAERLVDALARPFVIDGMTLELGVSIGLALHPEHGADAESLIERADAAMYRAKRDRLGFHVYERGAATDDSRTGLRADLRRALDTGGLELLYQPKIDARTGAIAGVEALVRWPHPKRGMLTPDDFLPIAEQTGLILPLTLWVLGMCLRDQQRWRHQGHDLPVSVNISAKWLRDAQFPGILRLLMRQMDGRPDRLILEINESGLMADPERAAGVLSELAALGCRVSLDDFGSGQSSLPWLQRLALYEIKIDRSIVAAMAHDRGTAIVVRSIVRLAHGLGLRTVGEGVETDAVAEALVALGCDEVQGYRFGHPAPMAEMSERLSAPSGSGGVVRPEGGLVVATRESA